MPRIIIRPMKAPRRTKATNSSPCGACTGSSPAAPPAGGRCHRQQGRNSSAADQVKKSINGRRKKGRFVF